MAISRSRSRSSRWAVGLLVLAAVGIFGYDGVHTALAASAAKDDATQIAHDVADFYHAHPDVNGAYNLAVTEAGTHGDTVPVNDFVVSDTGTVTMTVDRTNHLLLLDRIRASLSTMSGQASSTWSP